MSTRVALIMAAGRGCRFGDETPKQYLELGGRPVLRHALATFAAHVGIDAVQAVIHSDDRELYESAALGLKLLEPVIGGPTRQESVRLGLESLESSASYDQVLIHDGARPFVDANTITRVIMALAESPGAIAALPVHDTIKLAAVNGPVSYIATTVERIGLWQAQTPQGFRFADILTAHRAAASHVLTDDAAVAEQAGLLVQLVEGSQNNFKITTAADLRRARRRYDVPAEVRMGSGFDVHAFGLAGRAIGLCGVQVPHDRILVGHSDADVALHALTDALLGAVAAGDIGQHFPESEQQWQGVASVLFVRHAASLVRALGGEVMAVDITIFCEHPKVGPHRLAMVTRLAEILDIACERVSVKATTTEGLGFTGRHEGIAAHAIATVRIQP
ncbi:2-C-methyl-D-erythritol 4-phosphate cytidylyltransferase / 2-C-methyl-D- erythritol 2,4-cyclodiphosphate synthase [invertebrate metagenome]|uniref:2-C-methyl-D-erythritol 4-phosphate cytidylyltransferase / 2-C-methyl-D- erythritol 2,4-cyclodiphosphate synthase n=1 Tax=invertebrate metagenome TaxID=1711999 RepID=A0A484H8X9_9ZZZZ